MLFYNECIVLYSALYLKTFIAFIAIGLLLVGGHNMMRRTCIFLGMAARSLFSVVVHDKPLNHNPIRRENGNIFAMLFAATAMVGVLGVAGMQTVMGPATTITKVTQQNLAENDLLMNAKVVVMNASTRPQSGDEDSDGYVEPVPFRTLNCDKSPAGGGCLPLDIGAIQTDPWGTQYGYCVWDHGPAGKNSSAGRIDGEDSTSGAVLAIISAGPDKQFETPCNAYDGDPATNDMAINIDGVGDDLVQIFTYAAAVAGSGGLWELRDGEPTTAAIAKDIEVDGAFRMGFAGESDGQVGLSSCTDMNHIGRMRFNPIDNAIEVCTHDDGYGWETLAASGASVPVGTISAFNAAECPSNWEVVTELSGRMIMGVGGGYALGDVGGAATVTLTEAQMPSHSHSVDPPSASTNTAGNHSHTGSTNSAGAHHHTVGIHRATRWYAGTTDTNYMFSGGSTNTSTAGEHSHTLSINSAGNHAHTVNIPAFNSATAGSGQSHENRPPYRAYLYCMYMGGADGIDDVDSFNDIPDVDTSGVQDNDILVWDEGVGQWITESHWVKDGTDLFYNGGNVGIGTSSSSATLNISPSDNKYGIRAAAQDTFSSAVYATATGDASNAVYASGGFGVNSYGIRARTGGENGRAVSGFATGPNGRGVYARASGENGYALYADGRSHMEGVLTVNGNVGIGTENPSENLVVGDDVGNLTATDPALVIGNSEATGGTRLYLAKNSDDFGSIAWKNEDQFLAFDTKVSGVYNYNTLVIKSGNVGIGTTSPQAKLDVNGQGYFRSVNVPLVFEETDQPNGVAGKYWRMPIDSRSLRFDVDTEGDGDFVPYISPLSLSPEGTVSVMRLKGGGGSNFHIDASTVSSGVYLNYYSTGNVFARNTLLASSDRRLKTDITPIESALEKVDHINGVTFTWKDKQRSGTQIGVIAQDVETVFPELVIEDENGFKTVSYANLVAPLIEAVKELKNLFDNLAAMVTELVESVSVHDNRIAALEKEKEALRAMNDSFRRELDELKEMIENK